MNTIFTGQHIIHLSSVDSTNNYAAKYLHTDKIHDGTVILADEQTKGKGQRGNSWLSSPGENITCSVVYQTGFLSVSNQHHLTFVAAMAVMDLLHSHRISAEVKWPNDVMVSGKKIGGVLVENSLRSDKLQHSIIGIGFNVNQVDFPYEVNATSIRAITGKFHKVETVLASLCGFLEKRYLELKSSGAQKLQQEFEANMYGRSEIMKFSTNTGMLEGMVKGVNAEGKLQVETDGRVREFRTKEISFLS